MASPDAIGPSPEGFRAGGFAEEPPAADSSLRSSDWIQDRVERALLSRPGFSIRARLTLGFLLFFLLSTGVTVTAYVTLDRIEGKLRFLDIADRYTTEIQQARRFEKNYFLYGTNLDDVIEHAKRASELLTSGETELRAIVGEEKFRRIGQHQERYMALLERLKAQEGEKAPGPPTAKPDLEAALREHGAALIGQAFELAEGERRAVHTMLQFSKRLPLGFLAVLFPLIIYTAQFLARQMLGPLGRLLAATERIAQGDFTPIPPARRFRDEFTNLAIALNHMMEELQRRHDILIRSHKLRAVGTLTAGIAHELNNPINNITLTAAMLEEDYKTLRDEERLDMIHDLATQADRASRIVRNLLDFARESEMQSELLDVGSLMQDTLQLAANEIKLKKVKTLFRAPENLPPIYGDRQHLSQVFLNLILNALDAMQEGGRLEIEIAKSADPGFLALHFRDNGKGIPEHVLPYIFDPFFTTKQRGKGTGLGLSVSLGIVKKHGGDIRVQSREGQGTTFTVLLPVTAVPAELKSREPSETELPGGAASEPFVAR